MEFQALTLIAVLVGVHTTELTVDSHGTIVVVFSPLRGWGSPQTARWLTSQTADDPYRCSFQLR